jgi:hypothetical protein
VIPVVDGQATGGSNHKFDIWTGLLPTSTHCCGRAGGAGSPAPTPTEIGGASGGASTAIGAVINLETRHEVPHFEDPPEQPCGCQNGSVATTRREAEPP